MMVCMVRIVVLQFLVALAVVFATRVWIFRVWGRGFLCWCRWPMSCRIISNQQSAVESGQDRAVRDSRPSVSERAAYSSFLLFQDTTCRINDNSVH